ncbi:MAG: ATP-binding protein [Phycisphaerae bacterium]
MNLNIRKLLPPLNQLRFRATAVLCSAVLIATALSAVLYVRVSHRVVIDQARSRVRSVARTLAIAATRPMQTADRAGLLLVASELVPERGIRYVAFADPTGSVLAGAQQGAGHLSQILYDDAQTIPISQLDQPMLVTDLESRPRLDITYPIFAPTSPTSPVDEIRPVIGYTRIGLSLSDMEQQLATVTNQAVGIATLISLLAIPLGFGLVHRLVQPLQQLQEATREIAAGRLNCRVPLIRRDEIGDLAAAFNSMADDLERSHEELLRHKAELEDRVLARTFQVTEMNRRLQEEIAEKEDFVRAVTHDLSAPLRNVTGMVSLLREKYGGPLPEEAADLLVRLDRSVRHELELIEQLLELSRIRSRRGEVVLVDLDALVRVIAEQLQCDLSDSNITIELVGRLPVVTAEKMRMRQLWQNLIDNAIKYTDPSAPHLKDVAPTIRISAVERRDSFEFRVADRGIGIEPRDQERVFYVFRRARDGFVARTDGKGVGLASCKSIVQSYDGRIWVEPNPGGGSVFCFTLAKHALADKSAPVERKRPVANVPSELVDVI